MISSLGEQILSNHHLCLSGALEKKVFCPYFALQSPELGPFAPPLSNPSAIASMPRLLASITIVRTISAFVINVHLTFS